MNIAKYVKYVIKENWSLRILFRVHLENGEGKKLPRNIKIYGGLVVFNFPFPKIPNVFMFVIFGPSGHVHDLQKPLFLNLVPPNYSKQFKKNPTLFSKQIVFGNLNLRLDYLGHDVFHFLTFELVTFWNFTSLEF